jgi:hypothetical protein
VVRDISLQVERQNIIPPNLVMSLCDSLAPSRHVVGPAATGKVYPSHCSGVYLPVCRQLEAFFRQPGKAAVSSPSRFPSVISRASHISRFAIGSRRDFHFKILFTLRSPLVTVCNICFDIPECCFLPHAVYRWPVWFTQ